MGGKDPLLKIPLDIHEENKRLAPMLSEHRLGEKSEEVADNSGALSEKSEVIKSGTARFDEVKSGGLKEYD